MADLRQSRVIRAAGRLVFGKLMPRRPYRVLSGPLKGARFTLGTLSGAGGGGSVYFNGVEPEQTSALVRELGAGFTFFDVGANVGYYSILASRIVGTNGRVAAFEPVISNLGSLHRHVELNDADNVTIFPFAVSRDSGIAAFSRGNDDATGRIDPEARDMIVPTISLDEISERLSLMPDVIKIDVEGAELDVLSGANGILTSRRPVLFLSTHSPQLREQCLEHMTAIGYSVDPLNDSEDPHEFIARPDGRT